MKADNKIYGIAYRCPFLTRKDECPLKEINSFSFKEKLIWIEGLSRGGIEMIMEHHRVCSIDRESYKQIIKVIN